MTEYGCPGSIVVKELSFKREKKKELSYRRYDPSSILKIGSGCM